MRIIFHSGLNKTGSTYLQNALAYNGTNLRAKSISYPHPHLITGNSGKLTRAVENLNYMCVKSELKRLIEQSTGCEVALLSNESLYHQIIKKDQRELLFGCLNELNIHCIKFVCVFRNIYEHAISAYAHRAGDPRLKPFYEWIEDKQESVTSDDFYDRLSMYEFWGEYRQLCSALSDDRLQVMFLKYSSRIVNDFFDVIGTPLDEPNTRTANVSINLVEAEILRGISYHMPSIIKIYRDASKNLAKEHKASDLVLRRAYADLIEGQIARNKVSISQMESILGFSISERPQALGNKEVDSATNHNYVLSEEQLNIFLGAVRRNSAFRKLEYKIASSVPVVLKKILRYLYKNLKAQ